MQLEGKRTCWYLRFFSQAFFKETAFDLGYLVEKI